MKLLFSFIAFFMAFGVIDLVMRKFAAWRRNRRPVAPHYAGPTPAEHERRLKKEIGQFADAHAAANWEEKAIDQFEKTGRVGERNDVVSFHHWTNDPAYSEFEGNLFHHPHE